MSHGFKMLVWVLVCNPLYASKPKQFSQAMHAKTQALSFKQAGELSKAAAYFQLAVEQGLSQEYGLWQVADLYIKANQAEMALSPLQRLADLGNTQVAYFQSVAEHYAENDRYQAILAQVEHNLRKQKSVVKPARQGAIHTQDVDRFFQAFDQAKELTTAAAKQQVYERLYFDQASPGMVDYVSMKVSSIEAFVEHVERARPYYEDVRVATSDMKQLIPVAKESMLKMKQYDPKAADPDIYFVVGMHTSAGTASAHGVLLGADFIANKKDNYKYLKAWTHPYISDAEGKVWVVMHEYVHVLQNTDHDDVLGNALVEGGADFLANLLYAPPKQPSRYMTFGLANEALVKQQFAAQMNSKDLSLWTGNNGQDLPEHWVPDLGYFIGHQIAQRYYQQATDKKQAIRDLLMLTDPEEILAQSGYLSEP